MYDGQVLHFRHQIKGFFKFFQKLPRISRSLGKSIDNWKIRWCDELKN